LVFEIKINDLFPLFQTIVFALLFMFLLYKLVLRLLDIGRWYN
jgi:hypothetical protein